MLATFNWSKVLKHVSENQSDLSRVEYMSTNGPHVILIVDASIGHAQWSGIIVTIHVYDGVYFPFPRLKVSWCKTISRVVNFFDSPFAFSRSMMKPFSCKHARYQIIFEHGGSNLWRTHLCHLCRCLPHQCQTHCFLCLTELCQASI